MFSEPNYFWNFIEALNCLRHKMAGARCFWIFAWCWCDGKFYKTGSFLGASIICYRSTWMLEKGVTTQNYHPELTTEGEARKFMTGVAMPSLYEVLGGNSAMNSFWNEITDDQLARIYKEANEKKCFPELVAPGEWFAYQ